VTKRYDEPIEVAIAKGDGIPVAFVWRRRRYDVDLRFSTWREAGEWWDRERAHDREYHRLLARPAGAMATGDVDPDGFMHHVGAVYDVYRDRASNSWRLARIWD
jgi:hypothetical protein